MSGIDYWRQLDFLSLDDLEGVKVTVIGCGGIGSFVAFALAKLGVRAFELWDGDAVESHNIPNQCFKRSQVGKTKAGALCSVIKEVGDEIAVLCHESFWKGEPLEGIVISAVDDMKVRGQIWKACKLNPSVSLLVDGRIGGEEVKVLGVRPTDIDDIRSYEKTLYSNEEAKELPCTARAVIDVAFLVAALIVRVVRGFLKSGECRTFIASMHEPTIHTVVGG
mgnify:CR=1 FL=1